MRTKRTLAPMRTLLELLRRLYRAWRAAHARRQLLELSDRTLKDIGLKRAEIDSLFR